MIFRKLLIIFVVLFFQIFTAPAFASNTYFDFVLNPILLSTGNEYTVNFSYSLSGVNEQNFIVIPALKNGTLEIFNEEKNLWIKQNDFRSNFPKLKPKMQVKVVSLGGPKVELCFEIQYLKNTEIFKTPCKSFWNRDSFIKYIGAVNDRILKWVKEKR